MKRLFFSLFCLAAALACLGGIGCEKHSPEETIPGYAEKKQTAAQQKATKAEGANPEAPAYFPPKE